MFAKAIGKNFMLGSGLPLASVVWVSRGLIASGDLDWADPRSFTTGQSPSREASRAACAWRRAAETREPAAETRQRSGEADRRAGRRDL